MFKLLLVVLFAFIYLVVNSQEKPKKLPVDISTEFWMTYIGYPNNAEVYAPAYLRRFRNENFRFDRDTLKDSPLKHGAIYAAVKTITHITKDIRLNVDIYGEKRGISYGLYNQKNVVVYPIILLELKDTFTFFKHRFAVEGKVGDFLNEKLDEGLFIYNMDVQGGRGTVAFNKWKFTAAKYGDLTRGIALGIDDVDAVALTKSFGTKNHTTIGFSAMAAYPPGGKPYDNLHYSLFASTGNEQLRLYAQAGFQSSSNKGNFYDKGIRQQSAFVVGSDHHFTRKRFSSVATAEARYYGSSLNISRFSKRLLYRDRSGGLYANTVGDYLYPLRKYETPFSQWTVFAEYFTCDVFGFTLRGNMAYATSAKTDVCLDYDFNFISAAENKAYSSSGLKSSFLYGFFTASFYYKPAPTLKAGLIISNKGMNLNKSYPTYYLFTMPYFGFRIFKSV